jgi:hypothetical protein
MYLKYGGRNMKEGTLVRTTHLEEERIGVVFIKLDNGEVMVRWQDWVMPIFETLDECCLERVCEK